MDIGQWLRGLGLQSYEQAFRDNGIDFDVLQDRSFCGVLAASCDEYQERGEGHHSRAGK